MVIMAAAGRGLMAAGSKMMGGTAARSAGGQLLSTGGMKVGLEGKAMTSLTDVASGIWSANVMRNKMLNHLEKSSPALKQQMIIMRKGIMLIFRPIGDIMAKFIRPAAVWLMKFAVKWYQLFGTGASKDTKTGIEDKIKFVKEAIDIAETEGDTEEIKRLKKLLADLESNLAGLTGPLDKFKLSLGVDFGPDIAKIKEAWKSVTESWTVIKEWPDKIWTYFATWEEVINLWADTLETYFMDFGAKVNQWPYDIWDKYVAPGWKGVLDWADDIWTDYIEKGWEKMLAMPQKIWDDYIAPAWKGVKNWGTDLWKDLKASLDKLIDKIKSYRPSWWPLGDKAVGGKVEETGLYHLHAGEEVIRAGDTTRENNSSNASVNIINHFHLNATINNGMDIESLADQLAALQEVELRRRSSYM